MNHCILGLFVWLTTCAVPVEPAHFAAEAAPTATVAKKCLAFAYRVYPYHRPGAARASNVRQLYFNDCIAKNGEVAEPSKEVGNGSKPSH